ncbi:MAG: electron transfer flavoprotein beta subunit/FixA family protein [Brooklawnia sp.]|nr:electron transfer flavoprotein beta subunit/FixA family protein [Brooklawnia sp.]
MTIVVAYKYAANPQDASVGSDGRIDWSRAKETVSEYDPVAIQVGRQLADAAGSELVGITVGTTAANSSLARKGALSRGLDRAVIVADDAVRDWAPTRVGSVLAALVERIGDAAIVLTGDASVDEGAQVMPTVIAGYLGWPCFLEVISVAQTADGWELVQAHEGGTRTIALAGAAVVSVTTDATEARTPGMKDILAAGKKPAEEVALADLDAAEVDLTVTAHSRPATKAREHQVFSGDDAPAQLVAALRSVGVL